MSLGFFFFLKELVFVHSLNINLVIKAVGANLSELWRCLQSGVPYTVSQLKALIGFNRNYLCKFSFWVRESKKCQPFNLPAVLNALSGSN